MLVQLDTKWLLPEYTRMLVVDINVLLITDDPALVVSIIDESIWLPHSSVHSPASPSALIMKVLPSVAAEGTPYLLIPG